MKDLNKLRSEFESDLADHLIERDITGTYFNDEIQNDWEKHLLKAQIKELKAELEKAKAQAVPETHVLVPKEPTEKMLKRGNRLALSDSQYRYDAASIYEVMLEASESGAEG